MSGIDSVQQIVAAIRAEMATRVNATDPRLRPEQMRRTAQQKLVKAAARQQHTGTLISQRVQALDPDDPKRSRKAFRIFLESVLLAELGETLINDPAFYRMVDEVHRSMEQDPRIADAIGKAVAKLLSDQPG